MANRPFLDIPESDYQLDEPVVNPVEVRLLYDNPVIKDHASKDGGTYKGHYYGVNFNGTDYTMSASGALHKMIQDEGATKNTVVRILKKRIGPGQKEIRWSVSVISGPIDGSKKLAARDDGEQAQPPPPQQVAQPAQVQAPVGSQPSREYVPLKDNEQFLSLVEALGRDRLFVWDALYELVSMQYPEETSEWRRQLTTHLSIDVGKELYHKWEKERHYVAEQPEELDDRETAVRDADINNYPASYFKAVADGHDGIEDGAAAIEIIKKFGYKTSTHLPKNDRNLWVSVARIAWSYQDRRDRGMEEYYCIKNTADDYNMPYEVLDLPEEPDDDPYLK